MLDLPQITIVNVDGCEPQATLKTLKHCLSVANFGAAKLITYEEIETPGNIKLEIIPKLDSLQYNKFLVEQLHKYVETEYCLLIQNDGFICNADKWRDEFLNFDYIGAPWGQDWGRDCKYRVGNGGFSLRSKKFLDIVSREVKHFGQNLNGHLRSEDYFLCYACRDSLETHGLKWADLETAAHWSLEGVIPEYPKAFGETLGFHNKSTPESQAIIAHVQSTY